MLAAASFSQRYSWSAEQINSVSPVVANNVPFVYRLMRGNLSIERLRRALRLLVLKHCSLRTLFTMDSRTDSLIQRILEPHDDDEELFIFVQSSFNCDEDLETILHQELSNPLHFQLSEGRVFRFHIVSHQTDQRGMVEAGDYLVFNFHRIAFDLPSWDIFERDLRLAYQGESMLSLDPNRIRFIDCE